MFVFCVMNESKIVVNTKKKHFNRKISNYLLNTNNENESNEMFFFFQKDFCFENFRFDAKQFDEK